MKFFASRRPFFVVSYCLRFPCVQSIISTTSILSYSLFQIFQTRSFSCTLTLHKRNMPPKKVVKEQRILLGRPSNNLKIGVVGLPNVGLVFEGRLDL